MNMEMQYSSLDKKNAIMWVAPIPIYPYSQSISDTSDLTTQCSRQPSAAPHRQTPFIVVVRIHWKRHHVYICERIRVRHVNDIRIHRYAENIGISFFAPLCRDRLVVNAVDTPTIRRLRSVRVGVIVILCVAAATAAVDR